MAKTTAFLMAFALSAGTLSATEPELTRRQRGDLAIQSRAILNKYCSDCHKEGSARSSLAVLDHKQLVSAQSPVTFASRTGGRSQILEFLEDGSMPPAGFPRPTLDEVAILKRWVAANAPSYPKAFDAATTQRTLLEDFAQQPEEQKPYIRYLSMAHLVPAGTEPPSLKSVELALQHAVTQSSETPIPPSPVDDSATFYRFDIRALGWHTADLFEKVVDQTGEGIFPMNAYDLILLEYPDAAPITGPDTVRMKQALDDMKQLRPIPYLKADWFSEALSNKGKATPLAEELKELVRLASAREKKKNAKPDAKLNEDFGTRKSIQSAVPPLGAFYPKDVGSTAPPFAKLKLEVIDPKGDVLAQVETEDPFRLRLTAESDGYFLMLMRWSNGEIGIQEIAGGNKLKSAKKDDTSRILTPKSAGAFRITGLLNGKETGTEHFILFASSEEIPPPTIVRSLHGKFPIWRFIPHEPAKPGTVQRVVAPIEVIKRK